MSVKTWDVVGYVFRAEQLCASCVIEALPTGEGEDFDGWEDMSGTMSTEDNLSEIALAFGFNREDERSFNSGDFPKVIFSSQLDDIEECGRCGTELS